VRQKGRSADKCPERPDVAFYRFHHAGPGSDTELSRLSQRQIGNHLKNSRSEFRIVNYSFTPRVEMLAATKSREVVPTNVRRCR
jgi:hypothetical protein